MVLNAMVLVAGNESTAITHIVPDNSGNPSLVCCLACVFVIIDQDFAGAAVREVEQKPIQLDKGRTLQAKSTSSNSRRDSENRACDTPNCTCNTQAPSGSAPL